MFVVVGYLLHDILDLEGKIEHTPGGAAVYCGLAAKKLGMKTSIVSRVGRDYKYWNLLAGIDTSAIGTQEKTTVVHNIYRNGKKTMKAENVGQKITAKDFPDTLLDAKAIHFGPVVDEIDFGLVRHVKDNSSAFVSIDLQGLLRKYVNGDVYPHSRDLDVLGSVDLVHFSEDEMISTRLDEVVEKCSKVLFTRGKRSSLLVFDGKEIEIPTFKIENPIDVTGAGDTYTAAFVKRFLETNDPEESGRYASAAASFCVEGVGVSNLPTHEKVMKRLATL